METSVTQGTGSETAGADTVEQPLAEGTGDTGGAGDEKDRDAVDPRAEFRVFRDKFGDRAAIYFEQGLSIGEATDAHVKFLAEENASLRSAAKMGSESTALSQETAPAAPADGKSGLAGLIRRK